MTLTFAEYQALARRTQNPNLSPRERLEHATWGLASETGEVCGLLQKTHQGHTLDQIALAKEIGDCIWMLAEICDTFNLDMGEVARENIEKLKKRYPDGFSAAESLHRKAGDI